MFDQIFFTYYNAKSMKKLKKYQRVNKQLEDLIKNTQNPLAKMSTAIALLHHKFDYYFWTGFYFLDNGKLTVGPYQGSLACLQLKKDTGVCWKAINDKKAVIIDDVHKFEGHIACDSRSQSEIVLPVRSANLDIIGVLDIDSNQTNSFDKEDLEGLKIILNTINPLNINLA